MIKKIIFLSFFIAYYGNIRAQLFLADKPLDNQRKIWRNTSLPDTNRLKAIQEIALSFAMIKCDSAIILAKQELQLAQKAGQKIYEGKALLTIGISYSNKGEMLKARDYIIKALPICENTCDKKELGLIYYYVGHFYYKISYPKALEYYLKSLKVREEIKDKLGVAASNNNVGIVYHCQSLYPQALKYYFKTLKVSEELGDKRWIGIANSNIGIIYQSQLNYPKALEYHLKALKTQKETGDKVFLGGTLLSIGAIYTSQSDYSKALKYYLEALQPIKEFKYKLNLLQWYGTMGDLYYNLGNYKLALLYCDSALIDKKVLDIADKMSIYKTLAKIYSKTGAYKQAYNYQINYQTLSDTIFNTQNSKQLSDLKTNFEVEKKEVELNAKSDAEHDKQRTIIYSVGGILLLVTGFSFSTVKRLRLTRKQNELISEQKHQMQYQKELVEEKNVEILKSITYAKRIQQAILPPDRIVKEYLKESFILYKPKDIVAGDFYWMENIGDEILFAAADCTGHGVPGAMVSVVCNNALNKSLKEFGLKDPGKILDKTRELVIETFERSEEDVKDGMDISICAFNTKTNEMKWAGANNPLWLIRNQELIEFKGDKQPIGKYANSKPFVTHNIQLNTGDTFYIFTDGFADQFGGESVETGKKYMVKRFREFLISINSKPMLTQKEEINAAFENWKGKHEQVDDVCVIGVKV